MSKDSVVARYLEKEAKKVKPRKQFYPDIEGDPSLSRAAKELIELAEKFGENLAQEVEKDYLLGLMQELRRRDIPIINKVLRGLGFDISPIVYGALKTELIKIAEEL